ncbi:MAG: flagellar biosynthetic protein FliO [Candidatus Accumulibacter sp.]|uniref:Flagellar protein n=1 Tax=Candidatus Accumulibacter proximus TaxID=2954385 RepID=A0A935PZ15_9PROT|nr:flagellar biosynthetic protein FliO [Candidatus Accumulibacter proximus]MBL8375365.1 flagellar biosynthetic protein FliO [Accumulibacter sp.]
MSTSTSAWPTRVIRHFKPCSCISLRSAYGLLFAPVSGCTLAQEGASEAAGISASAMLQTVLGVAVVISILFLAAYLLRKLNSGRGFGNNGPLRVVGGLMVGTRERIVLVEIGDTWIVVGLVPGQIRTLHTLPKGELKPGSDGERHFAQWLKQITERKNEDG